MKSRLAKFTGVICLGMAIVGQGLAQSATPVPNLTQMQNTAMKLAIAGGAASAAVTVIALVAHHHHKSQSGKEKLSRGTPAAQMQSAPAVLKTVPSNEGGESKPAGDSQSFSSQPAFQY
jgi:hypothetical protein